MNVLFIDCSEHYHKEIDKIIDYLTTYFNSLKISNSVVNLHKLKITECTRCRCCTQKRGESPVKCVINDDMNDKIDKIEEADSYIIIADRHLLFRRNRILEKFSDRLIAYNYWPYKQPEPVLRKKIQKKHSILINFNTTKYFMNHSFYTAKMNMEKVSTFIGANIEGWVTITSKKEVIKRNEPKLKEAAYRLIASSLKKMP